MKLHTGLVLLALLTATLVLWSRSSSAGPVGDIFVSAQDGSDSWSGALAQPNAARTDGPLLTFDRARRRVQEVLSTSPDIREVHVQFRAGIYYTLTH